MGNWGPGLYQNDITQDVKDDFEESHRAGKPVSEITAKLMADYEDIMGDPAEEPLFWFALADTQWRFGVLLPTVKEKALEWLDKGCACPPIQKIGFSDEAQWNQTLMQLKKELISPPPSPKRPARRRAYQCPWKIGDVFAYPLKSELAKEKGLYGRYFLIQKVDETVWYPRHIVPIVYVKITKDDTLPANLEEYNQLEYVQSCFTKYENRFWPIDMSRPKEDLVYIRAITEDTNDPDNVGVWALLLRRKADEADYPDGLSYHVKGEEDMIGVHVGLPAYRFDLGLPTE